MLRWAIYVEKTRSEPICLLSFYASLAPFNPRFSAGAGLTLKRAKEIL